MAPSKEKLTALILLSLEVVVIVIDFCILKDLLADYNNMKVIRIKDLDLISDDVPLFFLSMVTLVTRFSHAYGFSLSFSFKVTTSELRLPRFSVIVSSGSSVSIKSAFGPSSCVTFLI